MAESGRKLLPREIDLAKELGARAGVALENARLYQTADARREELDAVLAALAEAVLVFDEAGTLRMGNEAARRTFVGSLPASLDELRCNVPAPTNSSLTTNRWRLRSTDEGAGTSCAGTRLRPGCQARLKFVRRSS